jgi:hypothetical protein
METMRGFRQKRRRNGGGEGGAKLPALADVVALMEYEVARARRYRRPLSLVAVPLDTMLASRVRLRFTDLFALTPDGDTVLVMLPETDTTGAYGLVRRIQVASRTSDEMPIVSFSEDGVTLHDLMTQVLEARRSRDAMARAS